MEMTDELRLNFIEKFGCPEQKSQYICAGYKQKEERVNYYIFMGDNARVSAGSLRQAIDIRADELIGKWESNRWKSYEECVEFYLGGLHGD